MQQSSFPVFSRSDRTVSPSSLPTMYDLPSEFSQEPGLPDVYHDLQPQLLSATLRLADYAFQERFTGTDINLYYDPEHTLWHKRPDWLVAVGVPYRYNNSDMRLSYVVWDEGVAPSVIIELLSPGTEKQDLGPFYRTSDTIDPEAPEVKEIDHWVPDSELQRSSGNGQPTAKLRPPNKWQVYEEILKVPYYIVFSRYSGELRFFKLIASRYQEQPLNISAPLIWLDDLKIGLGIWQVEYEGHMRPWLRWCDAQGNWLLTPEETEREAKEKALQQAQEQQKRANAEAQRANTEAQRANTEAQRANAEAQRAEVERQRRLALLEKLKQQGIEFDEDDLV